MITDEDAQRLLDAAFEAARANFEQGGAPIGAALGTTDGSVLVASPNRFLATQDYTAHAEICVVRDYGIQPVDQIVLATTLQPCWMCAGMIDLLRIPVVVVGDDESWPDETLNWLQARGTHVMIRRDPRAQQLLQRWIASEQVPWNPPTAPRPR